MKSRTFELDAQGYFTRAGARLFPVGVNYWPASCGVEMWDVWPAEEIQRDLDLVVALRLNCVRFFLRWQDFEPSVARYSPLAFARLREFLVGAATADSSRNPRSSSAG